MRKLLALVVLVPFAAAIVLSCDDHPTAPEGVRASTTVQEASTPQTAKVPALPMPVVLAGAEVSGYAAGMTVSSRRSARVDCSAGKWPITGGWQVLGSETSVFSVQTSAPVARDPDYGSWLVELIRTEGTGEWNLVAYAVCVRMERD